LNMFFILLFMVFTTIFFSNDYAILVGIDDYKYLADLKYARKDAEDLNEILSEHDFDIRMLTGNNVVKADILEGIKDISKKSDQNDRLLFFFSGHGINGTDESEKGLLTYYSDPSEMSYILSQTELKAALSKFKGKKIVILDACFQGKNHKDLSLKTEYFNRDMSEECDFILTSSAANQISNDGFFFGNLEVHNGIAAYYLIKSLKGEADANRDFCLTSEELENYFKDYAQFISGNNGQDIEVYFRSEKDEIFILKPSETDYKQTEEIMDETMQELPSQAEKNLEEKIVSDHEMVLVEGGKFMMGNNVFNYVEFIEYDEIPSHLAILNYDFWIGKKEVTFDEYEKFCNTIGKQIPDDNGFGRGQYPVVNISWWEAVGYCNWLSITEGLSPAYDSRGNFLDKFGIVTDDIEEVEGYRLPTEAEWEYAARGGRKTHLYRYAGSPDLEEVAWYRENSERNINSNSVDAFVNYEVGLKKPNELGLYDMSGNVWEWCTDFYDEFWYRKNNIVNPVNYTYSEFKIIKGGSTHSNKHKTEIADRHCTDFRNPYDDVGFRLVKTSMKKSEYSEIEVPVFNKGKLKIESNPQGATVYLNETELGKSPGEFEIDEGFYDIKFMKEGYETYQDYFYMKPDREYFINADLFETQREISDDNFNSPEMVFVRGIPFTMGIDSTDDYYQSNPSFEVILDYDYWIGKYEITNDEFLKCINDTEIISDVDWENVIDMNSKMCDIKINDYGIFCLKRNVGKKPVVMINKIAVMGFCNWLSEKSGFANAYDTKGNLLDKNGEITNDVTKVEGYRLPTEVEWEFAAMGGELSKGYRYSGRNYPHSIGWYYQNSGDVFLADSFDSVEVFMNNCRLHDVGTKNPNELGIHDMSGNAWEMCQDKYRIYNDKTEYNPEIIELSENYPKRGGGFNEQYGHLLTTFRYSDCIYSSSHDLGFRVARTNFKESEKKNYIDKIHTDFQ